MSEPKLRLPDAFRDLENLLDWALPTEQQRHSKRLSSEMDKIQSFYEVMLARTDEIVEYLNQFELNQIPKEIQPLLHLCLSFAEVANAVELFRQPSVPNGFDSRRFTPIE